jgi:hypothetical protein
MIRFWLKRVRNFLNAFWRGASRLFGGDVVVVIVARDPAGPTALRAVRLLDLYSEAVGQPCPRLIKARLSWLDVARARAVLLTDASGIGRLSSLVTSVFNVDAERNPMEGWEWCRLAQLLDRRSLGARRRQARARLRDHVSRLRQRGLKKVYLFGTGPSLGRAESRTFEDGYRVVCNTIVRDRELWEHLRPDAIAAGDAIYHFGHTPHAKAFRADLHSRLRESKDSIVFVYPELYDALVRHEFSDVEHLLVPVPDGWRKETAYSLLDRFELARNANVLTVLLLPLGATLARDIGLWGFDGRGPKDKLFWANSSRQSYPELLDTLRTEHPAFFSHNVPKGNEAKYAAAEHGDLLEALLSQGEKVGFRYEMLHETWTQALRRRMSPEIAVSQEPEVG